MLLYHTARRVFLLFPRNVENKDAVTVKLSVFCFGGKEKYSLQFFSSLSRCL